jgi:hypothetical protein
MMMFTVCCYDPRVMETLCNLSTVPIQSSIRPMMTLVCEDAISAASTFYEMFNLLQWMNLNVRMDFNMIQIEFPEHGTERLLAILLYLKQNYLSVEEKNSFNDGVLYSTTCWAKVSVPIKWHEHAVSK